MNAPQGYAVQDAANVKSQGDTVITVSDVSKSYGGVVANKDISLEVRRGGITGLIGPNGSGKTTLFNSIVGYHPIDKGSCLLYTSPSPRDKRQSRMPSSA